MEQQNKEYLHFSDHPVFKAVGMIFTTVAFVVSYFLFVFVLGVRTICSSA